MKIEHWAATDTGREPTYNEDSFLCDEQLNLFIVADGLGGHKAGDVASALCVQTVRDTVAEIHEMLSRLRAGDESVDRNEIIRVLEHALQTAATLIRKQAAAVPNLERMGTTCSLLLLAGEHGFVAHVGDSRVYLIRGRKVHQLSEDHSLANELQRRGRIKMEDLKGSDYEDLASAVTRAVGIYENVEVDAFDFKVQPGDRFLLCSDGLHSYLDDSTIARVMCLPSVRNAGVRMIDIAYQGGGHDNITAITVEVAPGEVDEAPATVTERLAVLPLFLHLDQGELARFAEAVEIVDHEDGDPLYAGHPGDALFVVLRGEVWLRRNGIGVIRFPAGALVSGLCLEEEAQRGVVAEATGATQVLVIRRHQLQAILAGEPQLAFKLQWSLAHLLSRQNT